jgi:hypothetical protein
MKIFFYKSVLVFVLFVLAIHFSFGLITKQIKKEYINLFSKEKIEYFKDKIRDELKNGVKKDKLLNAADAELLNTILIKLKLELEKNN